MIVPLISTAWLFDVVPKALGLVAPPKLHNNDGDELVFHRVRSPFARGVTQAMIADRLDQIPALQRENSQFWNWLGDRPDSRSGKVAGGIGCGVTMQDGTPVLGNVAPMHYWDTDSR